MKILFATGHLPSPKGGQAGAKVSYGTCEFLARTDEVHLLSFVTRPEMETFDERTMQIFASSELFEVSTASRLTGILSSPHLPLSVAVRTSSRYRRRLMQMVSEQVFDLVILDHTALFQYAHDLSDSVMKIGMLHDVLTQSWSRHRLQAKNFLRGFISSIELARLSAWEPKALSSMDLVVTLSGKDQKLAEEMMPVPKPVFAIQPWIDSSVRPSAGTQRSPEPDSLLFWGAMDRQENVDAALWIVEEILPRIRNRIPNAHLYIAGSKSDRLGSRLAGRPDVTLLGFVEDVSAMMASKELALLALRLGAGIKIKTLECLAAGVPVVTTEVGAEGIDAKEGRDLLIGLGAEQLATLCIGLLGDKAAGARIGAAGQAFFTATYDSESTMNRLRHQVEQNVLMLRSEISQR